MSASRVSPPKPPTILAIDETSPESFAKEAFSVSGGRITARDSYSLSTNCVIAIEATVTAPTIQQ